MFVSPGATVDLVFVSPGATVDLVFVSPGATVNLVFVSPGATVDLVFVSPGATVDLVFVSPGATVDLVFVSPGIGVPILLAYVYGVVPISLCRSGGCGVTTTNKGGVRFEFDDDNDVTVGVSGPYTGTCTSSDMYLCSLVFLELYGVLFPNFRVFAN